jgi:NADPH:quinone reductase-like Zn-dependent oxidoreductase
MSERVFATVAHVRTLGARDVIDYRVTGFAGVPQTLDAMMDTVGGETRNRATSVLKPGGFLVTVVSTDFVLARAMYGRHFSTRT